MFNFTRVQHAKTLAKNVLQHFYIFIFIHHKVAIKKKKKKKMINNKKGHNIS